LLSWTSHAACAIAVAGVRLATPGDWQCNGGSQYSEWAQHFSNASCLARSANLPEGLYILPMFFLYFYFLSLAFSFKPNIVAEVVRARAKRLILRRTPQCRELSHARDGRVVRSFSRQRRQRICGERFTSTARCRGNERKYTPQRFSERPFNIHSSSGGRSNFRLPAI